MKRRQPDSSSITGSVTPKKRRTVARENGQPQNGQQADILAAFEQTPDTTPSRTRSVKKYQAITDAVPVTNGFDNAQLADKDSGRPSAQTNGDVVFRTPQKSTAKGRASVTTPSKSRRADRSAKRKSTSALLEREDEEDWERENALAQEILEEGDEEPVDGATFEEQNQDRDAQEVLGQAETPSKRGRGRPKGSKNRRSPTPDGDIPPEERYFFQNRSGPPHVSDNTLASLKLLTHDEYFEQIRKYADHHEPEKKYLMKLHARSFLQWQFELTEGFNICLYGWGSKRQLVNQFAEWLYPKHNPPPKIVVVNGYTPKLNIRTVLNTLCIAVMSDNAPTRLIGQPNEILDSLLSHLTIHPPASPVVVMINSIDGPSLRRPATQSLLARLAANPSISVVATADTPSFPVMWNTTLRNQFNFAFHDCTTYAPYDAELNVVDDVHELLGRKGRRIGGKEGVGFVLKSLPENARNLYRVLLTEVLAILADGMDDDKTKQPEEEGDEPPPPTTTNKGRDSDDQIGVDLKLLYQKASEEFICSSEMNFRTLLKEFHDHEMIVSRRDASGTEVLGIPLGREDMEGVLEDLVVG
jgi:origin recognition complex subunit 2